MTAPRAILISRGTSFPERTAGNFFTNAEEKRLYSKSILRFDPGGRAAEVVVFRMNSGGNTL